MFTWMVKRDLVPDNTCRGIEHHKRAPAKRFLSNDEIRLVWPQLEDALRLVLLTAQRPGEVCHMRWEHLDLDAGLWSMPGAPTTGWPGTKNGHDHEVPLTDPVLALLRDQDPKPAAFVFPSTTRIGKAIKIPSTRDLWPEAGIPRFRPHDLRATAATKMDELRIVRDHIALVLNHTDGGVTASYVRHDKRGHKRSALEAWATELSAILEGNGLTDTSATVVPLIAAGR
jgi:integrase